MRMQKTLCTLVLGTVLSLLFVWLDLEHNLVVWIWLTMYLVLYWCCIFRVRASNDALLVVVPGWGHTVAVHLANPAQAFNKPTYQELPGLLSYLAELGVRTVTLTSPMFLKEGRCRSFKRLEKQLQHQVLHFESRPVAWWRQPMATASLFYEKRVKCSDVLKATPVTGWQRITLTLLEPN
ncbi:hypothetical protein [Vibrio sagamiensis]|uniref:hypothetical protein n=1 Tax=Vibrio sagamiensis TaxID=512650 RepID=UPI0011AFC910|nr:hypothetical protein [Vibrio sagamiensis]